MESDADLVAATAAACGTFSAALIRKSWPEITNRCTQEDVNGHNVSASAITCPRYKKSRVCAEGTEKGASHEGLSDLHE